jgi:hypothetical protein
MARRCPRFNLTRWYDVGYCQGFFSGVWSGGDVGNAAGLALFCPPGPLQLGQLELIFEQWARHNPQNLNLDAGRVVLAAWQSAFPCYRR